MPQIKVTFHSGSPFVKPITGYDEMTFHVTFWEGWFKIKPPSPPLPLLALVNNVYWGTQPISETTTGDRELSYSVKMNQSAVNALVGDSLWFTMAGYSLKSSSSDTIPERQE